MNFRLLSRIGVALLCIAEATVAFSQTVPPPAPTPEDQPSQTQEQTPGQTQEQTPAADAGQAADSGEQNAAAGPPPMQTPAPLNIDSNSLEFSGAGARGSYLRGGVMVSANYDDNLLSVSSPRVGGMSYTIAPTIGVDISRPRLSLEVNYGGGYTFNQRFSAYDQSAQSAEIDLRYRLSPHVNLRIYDHFTLTTGFFNQLQSGVSGLGSGVVQQPNLGVITPFTRRTDDLGTAELTYQYSASDIVGVSATGDVSSYGQPPAGAPALVDNQSEEGVAFYSHRFTPRNSSGIVYTFQRLTFDPVIETVDTHSMLLFHSIYLNRNTVVSFFAGPEYTQLNSEVVSTSITLPYVMVTSVATSQDRWSAGGGASFDWKGRHTSIRASGSRKVSDGGGLLTAVDLTSGIGAVRRQLTRNSTLEVGALYASSHAIDAGATTTYDDVKTVSGSLLWDQTIGRSITATLGYSRDYQQQTAAALPAQSINHNRGWITIAYHFSRPLGR